MAYNPSFQGLSAEWSVFAFGVHCSCIQHPFFVGIKKKKVSRITFLKAVQRQVESFAWSDGPHADEIIKGDFPEATRDHVKERAESKPEIPHGACMNSTSFSWAACGA
ncbi:hypothetical protein ADUPG1_002563 [Aduncisulcus paluster]|uniref:Uncharacterized protein n=1 Tax=Aduncisulcus paluster TaxID=2918883 RepID=A0ABQ5KM87_9EUKA|nr:hypothetical protein ADUPG1_002563 [Aduncisulcus paluster]